MFKNSEFRETTNNSSTAMKKASRCRSFHFRYMELCRSKNITPLPDIRTKNNATSVLDFYGDKFGVTDWLLIVEALFYDQVLQSLGIRLRKGLGIAVLEHLDTEKKAKLFRQKPVIYTKFIFAGVVDAIANCIEFNKNLKVLYLEGLPLNEKYVESIAKAMASNDTITEISFQRSHISDRGCEAVCNTIKYLQNIEILNLSECDLSAKGAQCVADMIKVQRISRYTEGWQKSLRYRDVDPDSIPGLRSIALARNPLVGDEGVRAIVEILKEDVWMKVIDMENCGLTDRAANLILDCLEINNYLIEFNVRGNTGMSKFLQRNIREQLGKDEDDQKNQHDPLQQNNCTNGSNTTPKKPKITIAQLKEQLKTLEEQLAFERVLRKKAEQLNEKLNQQIIAYENQMEEEANANIPEGYVVVKNESLQSIIRERNEYQKLASVVCSTSTSPRLNDITATYTTMNRGSSQDDQDVQLSEMSHTKLVGSASIHGSIKEQRKVLKVRKVKSEMKYVEPPTKDASKKKESKSDHEFANEIDHKLTAVQIETNIGDSAANRGVAYSPPKQIIQHTTRNEKKSSLICNNNKMDFEEEISLLTPHTGTSECGSSDSDTLRNMSDYHQPLQVFIRRNKTHQYEHGQGEGDTNTHYKVSAKSPRSLFLGLCDD